MAKRKRQSLIIEESGDSDESENIANSEIEIGNDSSDDDSDFDPRNNETSSEEGDGIGSDSDDSAENLDPNIRAAGILNERSLYKSKDGKIMYGAQPE